MYHALLPSPIVKDLKREYRIRLFTVALFFVSLAIVASAIFLFPSYLRSSLDESQGSAQADQLSKGQSAGLASSAADLAAAGSQVSLLTSAITPPLSSVAERVAGLRPAGITISAIEVSYSGGASSTVTISGVALTRDDLESWRQILAADAGFSDVQAPISDLAPRADLPFSFRFSAAVSPRTP